MERALKPIPHGTPYGYTRHKLAGEEACDACLAAHAKDLAAYRARKKATSGKNPNR